MNSNCPCQDWHSLPPVQLPDQQSRNTPGIPEKVSGYFKVCFVSSLYGFRLKLVGCLDISLDEVEGTKRIALGKTGTCLYSVV